MKGNDNLTDNKLREYFKRCFFAADGLWFVIVEQEFGFEKALDLDKGVWAILPKIQARKIRELLSVKKNTIHNLWEALEFKFRAEDYEFEVQTAKKKKLEIALTSCPWLKMMEKSGRQELARKIGEAICPVEYSAWASEFDMKFQSAMSNRLCANHNPCLLCFTEKDL